MNHTYYEVGGGRGQHEYRRKSKRFREDRFGSYEWVLEYKTTEDPIIAAIEKGEIAAASGDRLEHAAAEREFRTAYWFSDYADDCLILEAIDAGFADTAARLISFFDFEEEDRNETAAQFVGHAIDNRDSETLDAVLTALEKAWPDDESGRGLMDVLETTRSPGNNMVAMENAIGVISNPEVIRVLFAHGHGHWPPKASKIGMWFDGISWFQWAVEFGSPGDLEVLLDCAYEQGEYEVITFGSSACTSCMRLADSVPRWQVELNAPAKMWAHWPAGPPPKEPERVLDWVKASYSENWAALRRDAIAFAKDLRRARAEGLI